MRNRFYHAWMEICMDFHDFYAVGANETCIDLEVPPLQALMLP